MGLAEEDRTDISPVSSIIRALRICSFVLRFISNLHTPSKSPVQPHSFENLILLALMLLNQIIRQVSYKELCLIACCYKKPAFNCDVIDKYIRSKRDIDASEIFNYFIHMKNLGVFITEPPFVLGSNIGKIRLSFSGEALYELLELQLIPDEDMEGLQGTLSRIGVFK